MHRGRLTGAVTLALMFTFAGAVAAQQTGQWAEPERPLGIKVGGSPNVHVLSHIPLGGYFRTTDIEMEQDANRPYVYVSQSRNNAGFAIIDISNPEHAKLIYRWRIENLDLHMPALGGMDGKYFKLKGHYYYVQSMQFPQGVPDADLGAVVFETTGLPDVSKVHEVARIRAPDAPGGFHNLFAYHHSSGKALLIATIGGPVANVYDLEQVVNGHPDKALVGTIPVPIEGGVGPGGYHDFYAAYDPATGKDKFYGAGRGGYYVYDITDIANPQLLFSITGTPGVEWGHTFTPTPDGAFAVTETEYQYAPLRIYDLRAGQAGEVRNISKPIGAWTADWQALSHNHEVRWPYVFVSAYEDGLQIFNMMDPAHPTTTGWYYTYDGPHDHGFGGIRAPNMEGDNTMNGAFGVDVRNVDGLIALSDAVTGFWLFRLDGFSSWNGEDWGTLNISSVQDWDHTPGAAPGR